MINLEAKDGAQGERCGLDSRRPEDLALPFSDSGSSECSLIKDNDNQIDAGIQVGTADGVVAEPEAKLEKEPRYVVCGYVYEHADKASPPMHLLSLSKRPDATLLVPTTQPLATTPTPRPCSWDKDSHLETEVESFDKLPQGYAFVPTQAKHDSRVLQIHLGPDQTVVREIYPPPRGCFFWTMLLLAWVVSVYWVVAMDRAADARLYGDEDAWEQR
ncbi:hypothetical protein CDD81_6868 [Ophiocordyceps australis]|uniref:Uncharacterized protein n=1 Tax=Ophiocordyceps australis TaxID=1399860 RepID=A0A2C5Y6P8_9HYPO|nr:hypothetical protein CDD81_6868 [Ophiocordyceps australis]